MINFFSTLSTMDYGNGFVLIFTCEFIIFTLKLDAITSAVDINPQ